MRARAEGLPAIVTKAVDTVMPQPLFARGIDGQPFLTYIPDPKRTRRRILSTTAAATAVALPLSLAGCSSNGEQTQQPSVTTITVTAEPTPSTTVSPSLETSAMPTSSMSTSEVTPSPSVTSENPKTSRIKEALDKLALHVQNSNNTSEEIKKEGDPTTPSYGITRIEDKIVLVDPATNGKRTVAKQIIIDQNITDQQHSVTKITVSDQRRSMPHDYNEGWYGDYSPVSYIVELQPDGSYQLTKKVRLDKAGKQSQMKEKGEKYTYRTTIISSDTATQDEIDVFFTGFGTLASSIAGTPQ